MQFKRLDLVMSYQAVKNPATLFTWMCVNI